MYAFEPSGEKARLAGPEPTKTVLSTTSVFVLMIATEFWDGIVAYISGCVGLITNDEAEKLYCATISPKAAWALFATNEALSQQISPRTSRVGKQNTSCANRAVGMSRWIRVICRSGFMVIFSFFSLPPATLGGSWGGRNGFGLP
jgi:hypothetical protein